MKRKRIVALLLSCTLSLGMLSGCGSAGEDTASASSSSSDSSDSDSKEKMVRTDETISNDSKWVNSEIDGAIDQNSATNVKDDFFTYVNKDWILSTEVTEEKPHVERTLGSSDQVLKERMVNILTGVDDPNANGNAPVPADELAHDEELVTSLASAISNWDQRDADGVEPLKNYIAEIENISSIDDLTAYILNEDQQNLFSQELLQIDVEQGTLDATHYYVLITNETDLTLPDACYTSADSQTNYVLHYTNEMLEYVLERLGYGEAEADDLITECYKFEGNLYDHKGDATYYATEWPEDERAGETTSREELAKLQGDYPLTQLLEIYGYDTDDIIVKNPSFVKYIANIYDESHLDEIKAYLTVHTIFKALYYLDRECYDKLMEYNETVKSEEDSDDGNGDQQEQEINDDDDVMYQLVHQLLQGTLDTVYIAKYCTVEEKEDLTKLTQDMVAYYKELFQSEDWMGDETKEAAIEKLEAMAQNILYPNEFQDHSYLDFGGDTQVLDMVADICAEKRGYDAYRLGKEVDRSEWNLDEVTTAEVNSCYIPSRNSINIQAGFIAGDVYDINQAIEEKYAMMGCVVGHEITHGFDTTGAYYDKYGNEERWWTLSDLWKFEERALNLETYYKATTAYPGGSGIDGSTVSGEAIADMGGMKCMLGMAKNVENFDYDLFFTSFAKLWGDKSTYDMEVANSSDVHPLNYFRVNITVMQFDEFYDTYGVQKGDGMYLAEKDRIAVW